VIFSRRQFLASSLAAAAPEKQSRRPNVVFVLTDDQGFGDLSINGNPYLKTPNSDAIGREGVQFSQFQVCPVCSPTRSSLMTGRYNYRTGVVDTFLGRSLMYPDEVTIAEILRDAGYRTGIFGKWHLGDNYPMRAMDQGFEEALVIKGGGIGQPSDPPGSGYFNPVLQHNGQQKTYPGYCTDVFFDAAMSWIETGGDKPFFAYIPTNAPHSPLIVGEEWVEPFRKMGLPEDVAKTYGMIANIDVNVGKLTAKLRALNLERDTLLIFMTDNGATGPSPRYNAGMRDGKGTPYQGGIRVPCFFRWPGKLKPSTCDRIAAHIDLLPTILEVCGVRQPPALQIDGKSLWPLAQGAAAGSWPDRMLFTQWHRGDRPEPFRASAVRTQRYKLVNGRELYDMASDPGESHDIAAANPDVVAKLRAGYSAWFESVSSVRHFLPSRIYLGTSHENPVVLTRQDWRVPPDVRQPVGWWEVDVKKTGKYDIKLIFDPLENDSAVRFQLGAADKTVTCAKGARECLFQAVDLSTGAGQLRGSIATGKAPLGPKFVEVRSL
jgi:arylsulfatase A-like enzyme